ncbi:MAG: hypothetical protein K2X70_14645 [Candidatus Obscuribacterales bacterium]|nr:hypothetical protein [Candidatus Obscuribacterales bacterium]
MHTPNQSDSQRVFCASKSTASSQSMTVTLLVAGLLVSSAVPAYAQLPPVNMGKFIHQPGDNQYSSQTQQARHGAPGAGAPVIQQPMVQMRPMARTQPKADISLDPVVCDEPVPKSNFPPLPDRLDLPGMIASTSGASSSRPGGGGFSSTYGGGSSGITIGSPTGGPIQIESKQGYQRVAPGAFAPPRTFGKKQDASSSGDVYSSGDGSAMSDTQRQLKQLGREPGLAKTEAAAPEAPQAVQVNQSSTQDLSLPDDEYKNRGSARSQSQAGKVLKNVTRRAGSRMMNQIYRMPMGF